MTADVTQSAPHRVVAEIRRRYDASGSVTPFAVRMLDGSESVVGTGEPQATLVVSTQEGLDALSTFDVARLGEAYLDGELDAEGDLAQLLTLRAILTDRHPVQYAAKFIRPLLRGQVRSDHDYIEHHYEYDPDFYLAFLDRRHRAYSQGVFEHPDEPLEDGITRKLDYALGAIDVPAGARVRVRPRRHPGLPPGAAPPGLVQRGGDSKPSGAAYLVRRRLGDHASGRTTPQAGYLPGPSRTRRRHAGEDGGPQGRQGLALVTRVEAVVLDLDGTLVDSVYVHALAWKEAFREVGLDVPTYQLHRAVGMGGDRLVTQVAGEAAEHAIGDVVRKLHDDLFHVRLPEVHPLEGATELLGACRDHGLRMVLATSSPPELTDALLALVEDAHLIGEVVSGSDGPSKPAPDLVERAMDQVRTNQAFLVGDAVWDVKSAERAGIACVGLLTGGYSDAELRGAGAVAVYDTPRSLATHLDQALELAS